jgi:hypothetical protein
MIKKTIPYKLTTNARQSEGELLMPAEYDLHHQVFRLAHLMREDGGPFLFVVPGSGNAAKQARIWEEGRQGRRMLSS